MNEDDKNNGQPDDPEDEQLKEMLEQLGNLMKEYGEGKTEEAVVAYLKTEFGFKDDELKSLAPTLEKKVELANSARKLAREADKLDLDALEDDPEEDDTESFAEVVDSELSDKEKFRLRVLEDEEQRAEEKRKAKAEQMLEKNMADQSHLPEEEQVTPKDARQAFEDLLESML